MLKKKNLRLTRLRQPKERGKNYKSDEFRDDVNISGDFKEECYDGDYSVCLSTRILGGLRVFSPEFARRKKVP